MAKPQLGDFLIKEGGKFTGEKGLVVKFSEYQSATLLGDNKEGKSTALGLLSVLLGRSVKQVEIDALVNKFSGKLDATMKFKGKSGQSFEVTRTKSQYYLRLEGDKKDISSPQATIIEELGHCAYNPHKNQLKPIGELVKYLVPFSNTKPEDYEKGDKRLKGAVEKWEKVRADANREAKGRIVTLSNAGFATDKGEIIESKWVAAEKQYAAPLDLKKLSATLDAAGKKSDLLLQAETKRKDLKAREERLLEELAEVQKKLKVADKYIDENKEAKKEYDSVKKQYDEAAQFDREYQKWEAIKTAKTELDEYESAAQLADSKAKAAAADRKELQLSVIPECKGLAFQLEDEPNRPAGFYVDGFNAIQMSGTEYLVAILKILRKLKCRVLILDGTADFGSDFTQILEQLKKEGWYILMSEMSRGQSLTIEY